VGEIIQAFPYVRTHYTKAFPLLFPRGINSASMGDVGPVFDPVVFARLGRDGARSARV